ncbi:MAG: ribbon-helix-helix domain-containing protein [Stenomitos rutilans HA7619-LM2]|jgi:hypothetical protein|nr:ribbon-helix-helix domain-containing protein [Stenomitos rutilans HA7619-LM2]
MSTKKEGSRFDNLFGAVRSGQAAETSERSDTQTSNTTEHLDIQTSKSKDPNYQRTTIYLPKAMHRRLKAAAATEGKEMSAIMEELLELWLDSRLDT